MHMRVDIFFVNPNTCLCERVCRVSTADHCQWTEKYSKGIIHPDKISMAKNTNRDDDHWQQQHYDEQQPPPGNQLSMTEAKTLTRWFRTSPIILSLARSYSGPVLLWQTTMLTTGLIPRATKRRNQNHKPARQNIFNTPAGPSQTSQTIDESDDEESDKMNTENCIAAAMHHNARNRRAVASGQGGGSSGGSVGTSSSTLQTQTEGTVRTTPTDPIVKDNTEPPTGGNNNNSEMSSDVQPKKAATEEPHAILGVPQTIHNNPTK